MPEPTKCPECGGERLHPIVNGFLACAECGFDNILAAPAPPPAATRTEPDFDTPLANDEVWQYRIDPRDDWHPGRIVWHNQMARAYHVERGHEVRRVRLVPSVPVPGSETGGDFMVDSPEAKRVRTALVAPRNADGTIRTVAQRDGLIRDLIQAVRLAALRAPAVDEDTGTALVESFILGFLNGFALRVDANSMMAAFNGDLVVVARNSALESDGLSAWATKLRTTLPKPAEAPDART